MWAGGKGLTGAKSPERCDTPGTRGSGKSSPGRAFALLRAAPSCSVTAHAQVWWPVVQPRPRASSVRNPTVPSISSGTSTTHALSACQLLSSSSSSPPQNILLSWCPPQLPISSASCPANKVITMESPMAAVHDPKTDAKRRPAN
ncbi:hypothetical protein SETIT_4G144100v2 [Setaria italica]|uniref:Uncharacterized protein n=1 Tax=Setaria italica TaxID=4555 RepID=A0A368QU53_SETIT|nr:hypothetical protein SETIT_4G144100v2 [Setaria italica]